jgi:hypothetical protein
MSWCGFPGIVEARAWWDSPAYQEIAPLRSRHIEGEIILVEGVPEDYDPTGAAKAMREAPITITSKTSSLIIGQLQSSPERCRPGYAQCS